MTVNWPDRSVASLATYINGYPFKPEDHSLEGLPIIRIKQLNDPSADVDYFSGVVPSKHHIKDGDLIFSWSGSLSVGVWDRGPALLNQHLFRVIPAPGIDQAWLRWLLYVAADLFAPHMHGSAMTHITLPMMRQVRVGVPPMEEQRRIADYLGDQVGRIDRVLQLRREQLDLVSARSRSVLLGAFFDGQRGDSHGVWPPPIWPLVRLNCIATKLRREVPATSEVVTAFRDGLVVPRSMRREEGFTLSELEQGYQGVCRGDLVFHGLDGFAGAFGVAVEGGRCSPVYHVLDVPREDPQFVSFALRASVAAGLMEVQVPSTRQRAVDFRNWEVLGAFPVPRPDLRVQRQVVRRLTEDAASVERLRATGSQSIARFLERKRSLITGAVTGEYDVTTTAATRV